MKSTIWTAALALSQLGGLSMAQAESVPAWSEPAAIEWGTGQSWESMHRGFALGSVDSVLTGSYDKQLAKTLPLDEYAPDTSRSAEFTGAPSSVTGAFSLTSLTGTNALARPSSPFAIDGSYVAMNGIPRISQPESYAMILAGLVAIGAIARKRAQG
jgi:hypothetical protein